MLPQLAESIKKVVEDAYKQHVTLDKSIDGVLTLQANAQKVLVRVLTCSIFRAEFHGSALCSRPFLTLCRLES
jgi:hypothetical protein